MKKRAKICFYIFLVCAVFALGVLGYFVFRDDGENVMVGSRKFVTFRQVPNAVSYSLSIKNTEDEASSEVFAKYQIEKTETDETNIYDFKTEVYNDANIKIAEETYKQQILSINENANLMDCIIKNYTVKIFNGEGDEFSSKTFKDQRLRAVDTNTLCCVVSEYFDALFTEDGKYHIVCTALDDQGNEIENSQNEFDYDYYAYYESDFLRRGEFYINGANYDFVVSSNEELKMLVWRTILYRQNDVKFYVKTNDIKFNNINSLVIDAINNYPEYDALNDARVYGMMQEKIGKLVNFNYYLEENFTKNYEDLEEKDAATYAKALENLYQKDTNYNKDYVSKTGSERTFAIDTAVNAVKVFNSEQLFMAVQYGAKPVFEDGESVVKTVYENAKTVLRTINNSDELSDYEKALNIYNYLCMNVVYDYVTYEYMDLKDDFSIVNFGNFSCFYLEGTFLDLEKQYAVCDGIAKAFVLLCQIEGIDAVKVNGEVVGQGNHAWNKINLIDDAYNLDGWYYVDGTWGVATYEETKEETDVETNLPIDITYYYEIPTHTYFLVGEDISRIINFEAGKDEDAQDYDFYQYQTYSFEDKTENFVIESDAEFCEIIDFAEYNLIGDETSALIEFEISSDYDNLSESLISQFRYLNNVRESLLMIYNIKIDKLNKDTLSEIERNFVQQEIDMLLSQLDENKELIDGWFVDVGLNNQLNCDWFVLDNVLIFRIFE